MPSRLRPGTEINELTWGQIEIKFYPTTNKTDVKQKDRKHEEIFAEDTIEINPNITAILKIGKGKTGARHCIGRGPTVTALRAIALRNHGKDLNDVIKEHPLDKIILYKQIVTKRQKNKDKVPALIKPTSFSRLFDTYLIEHNLLMDSVTNKRRVLYSLRHTYATIALQIDRVEIHTLALQMGTSVSMIEKHYSHLDAVKAVNQLRGEQSRQLIEAQGAIDDRYQWDEEKSKTPIKKKSKRRAN